jgi:hypothetical protein
MAEYRATYGWQGEAEVDVTLTLAYKLPARTVERLLFWCHHFGNMLTIWLDPNGSLHT